MSGLKFHIPDSWELSKLPDIAEINMGQSPSSSYVNEHGEGMIFFQGKAEFGKLYPIPRKYCTKPTKTASAGNILLSVRAPVGPTNIATQTTAIGRGLAAISAIDGLTSSKYLLYYFRYIEPWLSTQGTGSTFKAISGGVIKQLVAPTPSFYEQKIIAEKLDTLLAQVDSTKARLEQVLQILKRFRQAVLAAAVSGELTKDLHVLNGYKNTELKFTIPASWIVSKIDQIANVKGGKRLPKGESLIAENSGFPYIRAGQLKNGTVVAGGQLYLEKHVQKTISKYIVSSGDLYITIVGACIGDTGIIPEEYNNANLTENAAKLCNLNEKIFNKFLSLWLRSSYLQDIIQLEIKSGAQGKLALSRIKSLPILLPPLPEQHEIVRRVEQLFGYADTIEKLVNNALACVNNLTQSILAKAFRGELTAQWRAENPDLISGENSAAALLEKIKAERIASGSKKASRKKK